MTNKNFYILLILVVSVGGYSFFSANNQPKIGVVDFNRLVMEFDGMQDAMYLYEQKAASWENHGDSLQTAMSVLVNDLETNEYSEEVVYKKEYELILLRNTFAQLQEQIGAVAQEEDQKLTSAVLLQVMDFVKIYGEDNGYDVIYGSNQDQYVLYRSNEFDITDVVLAELNKNYSGE